MWMRDIQIERHKNLRKFMKSKRACVPDVLLHLYPEFQQRIEAYSDILPDAILSEIRPELDFGLLLDVADAIEHLLNHVQVGGLGASFRAEPKYPVQQAAVNYVLLREFAKAKKTLLNPEVFSEAAKEAEGALLIEIEAYCRKYGKGAREIEAYYRKYGKGDRNGLYLFKLNHHKYRGWISRLLGAGG